MKGGIIASTLRPTKLKSVQLLRRHKRSKSDVGNEKSYSYYSFLLSGMAILRETRDIIFTFMKLIDFYFSGNLKI